MVVYQDYRCLLTGSSLVDYNDDEITPLPYSTIQFLPSSTRTFYLVAGSLGDYTSIYYHLHYHILEGVVWETTGAQEGYTILYKQQQQGTQLCTSSSRCMLYYTSSRVHHTIQAAANRYVEAAVSSSNMETYKQERESRNGYIVVLIGRRCA